MSILRDQNFASWLPEDGMFGHSSEEEISAFRAKIDPDAAVGKGPNSVDEYYGVPFHKEKLLREDIQAWSHALTTHSSSGFEIPEKNRFIPTELTALTEEHMRTRLIRKYSFGLDHEVQRVGDLGGVVSGHKCTVDEDKQKTKPLTSLPPFKIGSSIPPSSELWFSEDQVFGFPKSVFVTQFRCSAARDGHPENSLITNIFTQLATRRFFQVLDDSNTLILIIWAFVMS